MNLKFKKSIFFAQLFSWSYRHLISSKGAII